MLQLIPAIFRQSSTLVIRIPTPEVYQQHLDKPLPLMESPTSTAQPAGIVMAVSSLISWVLSFFYSFNLINMAGLTFFALTFKANPQNFFISIFVFR
jgi:hypothetical protein